jgi:hypothetical protein
MAAPGANHVLPSASPDKAARPESPNLLEDPSFEAGVSGFVAQDSSSAVDVSKESPLEGGQSLRVSITGYGNNVWWSHGFAGGLGRSFLVKARARSIKQSASTLQFCAMAYYADGTTALKCTSVSGSLGDKGRVTARLDLDPAKRLDAARIRLFQEGSSPLTFLFDEVLAELDVIEAPPVAERSKDIPAVAGSGEGSGAARPTGCPVPATSLYPGFRYNLPTTRPFISLSHYSQASKRANEYARFKAAADAALAGSPPYAYSATHSVTMYHLTSNAAYINDAISRVEAMVAKAEALITAGRRPEIASDSYLEVGSHLLDLSLTYDHGYSRLSPSQRQRFSAFAEQTLHNVWNPPTASWGGVSHPWSGWSICDPGNNYHFSFLRATMLWALASQNAAWLDFLQTQKFGPLVSYYAQLPGGGSREGTGYGTAQMGLFLNYLYWGSSTGEQLASLTPHTRETIDYWVHATVPTRDRFAPIGDLSRSSIPELYDYHENLVHAAVALSPGTSQSRRGVWWLQNNSVTEVRHSFNLQGELLPYPDPPLAPTELVYHASGAGALFARSSWATDATWVAIVAGKYDQSHAHQDQGSFTLFRRDWLAVTHNIWSHSGINQGVEVHNVLRFERADGKVIAQRPSETLQSTMTSTSTGGVVTVAADVSNAYWRDSASIQSWTRTFELSGNTLRVTDACRVASGIKPVFQLQVPTLPVQGANGVITAGKLTITPLQPVTVAIEKMPAPEFSRGYRISFTSAAGCSFKFELQAS